MYSLVLGLDVEAVSPYVWCTSMQGTKWVRQDSPMNNNRQVDIFVIQRVENRLITISERKGKLKKAKRIIPSIAGKTRVEVCCSPLEIPYRN